MNKLLLLLTCSLLSLGVLAQTAGNSGKAAVVKTSGKTADKVQRSIQNLDSKPFQAGQSVSGSGVLSKRSPLLISNALVDNIGSTSYDLQSNSSVARRLVNYGNGTLTATWTWADPVDGDPWPSRGTGYNHFDGTSWTHLMTERMEGSTGPRTGWPTLGKLGSGKEMILSHNPQVYNLHQGTNSSVGSTSTWSWAASGATLTSTCSGGGNIWARMAVSGTTGNYVHVISNSADSTCKKMGIKQPFLYSRSDNAGASWAVVDSVLPGLDSTITLASAADDYAIDSRDSVVAIVHTGLGESTILWKSTNNGMSFTKMYVDSFPFMPDITVSGADGDTGESSDGSISVFVDENHVVHVVYSFNFVFMMDDGTGNITSFFSPVQTALVYWNDVAQTKVFLPMLASHVDLDGDTVYNIGAGTTIATPTTTGGPAARYGNNSLLCKPSIASDDNNNMFIVFSLPTENDSTPDGQNFRDIWVRASTDNGATWPDNLCMNLTCSQGYEEAFPDAAKLADGNLHIMFQVDPEPGTTLTNDDTQVENDVCYIKVPVASILDESAGCNFNVGIKSPERVSTLFMSEMYPNPSNGISKFDLNIETSENVNVTITNLLGQELQAIQYGQLGAGLYTLQLDASTLSTGLYLVNVKAGEISSTKKLMIQN